MRKITLSLFTHRKKKQIKIAFEYNYKVKEIVKEFKGVKWSNTQKTFYLPFSKENTNQLYSYLKQKGLTINYQPLVEELATQKTVLEPIKPVFKNSLQEFRQWMLQKRYSQNTIKTYGSMIDLFFRFHKQKNISEINKKDI